MAAARCSNGWSGWLPPVAARAARLPDNDCHHGIAEVAKAALDAIARLRPSAGGRVRRWQRTPAMEQGRASDLRPQRSAYPAGGIGASDASEVPVRHRESPRALQ